MLCTHPYGIVFVDFNTAQQPMSVVHQHDVRYTLLAVLSAHIFGVDADKIVVDNLRGPNT